jgi:hypothetical protein
MRTCVLKIRVYVKICAMALAMATAMTAGACGKDKSATPTAPTPTTAHLTAPAADSPGTDEQLDNLRPTLTVRNGTSDQPSGTRTYEFQISDSSDFSTASAGFSTFRVVSSKTGVPENATGKTSFVVDADLQPTTRFYWRARVVQGTSNSDWSQASTFKTKLVGYSRPGELYDPLIHGETVGEVVGNANFIPGKGIHFNNGQSYVRYLLPQTVTNGEFSMDVEGLAANGPGDKAKVFGMQEGTDDFITNRYRVDIQYRGVGGVPPNAITWRVLYGSATDLSVRYEPDTTKRFASVFLLNPANTYHWRATWGTDFHVTVLDGGVGGSPIYDFGLPTPKGQYAPNPHYAYLGAPVGRSGTEAATIAGTTYRNVWLGNHPRPASLGSALYAIGTGVVSPTRYGTR